MYENNWDDVTKNNDCKDKSNDKIININKYMGKNDNIKDNNKNHANYESDVDRKKHEEKKNERLRRIKATTRVITYKVK